MKYRYRTQTICKENKNRRALTNQPLRFSFVSKFFSFYIENHSFYVFSLTEKIVHDIITDISNERWSFLCITHILVFKK